MKKASMAVVLSFLAILLFGCSATMSPLMQAIEKGDLKTAEALLNSGADMNEGTQCNADMPEYESYTVLGCAAKNGRTDAVKLLLDRGADMNKRWGGYRFGFWNPTPLLLAASEGRTETVRLLLDRGADANATDTMLGISALMISARGGDNTEIAKLLLGHGADVNGKSHDGTTPLIFAAEAGRTGIVKILLERGANVNAKKGSGTTPLSMAAYAGHHDIVKILADSKADVEAALVVLESRASSSKDASERTSYKQGISLLEKYAKKKEATGPSSPASAISKEELKSIVQAAVEGASKAQKDVQKSSSLLHSEIDEPDIAASRRLMGDDDLAVVIGIEGYQSLPKSDYSYDDAKLVKEYVKALGFREQNIELLTDEKATHSGIVKVIEAWLRNKAKADGRVLVYYSGHGAPDPATGEAYIVPYDGDPNYLPETGYPLKRLYEKLGNLPAREVVVVLDACFSGSGGRSVLAKGARPLVMSTAALPVAPNMAVLTATQGAQISSSSPEKGHGIFTYYFLKALKEGKKNISDIYEYLKPQVEDDAKAINVRQTPGLNPAPEKIGGRFQFLK